MAQTVTGLPEDIEIGLDENPGRRPDDGKFAAVWVELSVLGDPEKSLTPGEARILAHRLWTLAKEADQITSTARSDDD